MFEQTFKNIDSSIERLGNLSSFRRNPGGHPKSPTRGRVKIPHLDAVNRRWSAPS